MLSRRLPLALLVVLAALAAAASSAPTSVRAQDAPAPAQPAAPTSAAPTSAAVRFRPAPGAKYGVLYSERIHGSNQVGKKPIVQDVKADWRLEFTASAPSSDGSVALDVKIVSVKGEHAGSGGRSTFDSAAAAKVQGPDPNPELGRCVMMCVGTPGRVVVTERGEVKEVANAFLGIAKPGAPDERRRQELTAFFERFFQTLPAAKVGPSSIWNATRFLAPHFVVATQHMFGAVTERCRVTSYDGATAVLAISGSGSGANPSPKIVPTALPYTLGKWSMTGTATIDVATGLALSRTTSVKTAGSERFEELDVTTKDECSYETTLTVTPAAVTPSESAGPQPAPPPK